jgi:hypothetical protein
VLQGGIIPKDEWRESLRPRIDAAKAELLKRDPTELARRGGLTLCKDGLELPLLGRVYSLRWPELALAREDGEQSAEELQILVLDYLANGDGTPPTSRFIGFQELPDGAFYRHAFQGYSGDQLVRDLGGDVETFRRAAESLGGEPLSIGDAGYAFRVLPHVMLAVVWWAGDEEFAASATVLFDASAGRYLPTDGLAILGRMLCQRLTRLAEAE